MYRLAHLKFEQPPIVLAPMEDVTDLAFRLVCKRRGADVVYTEFVSSEAIIRDIPKTLAKMDLLDEERPIGIQRLLDLVRGGEVVFAPLHAIEQHHELVATQACNRIGVANT